ncbi:MAG: type II/IV secretion system protein [Planctomycetota bacterium]|nr:MAG: type II/IV secretion system protein [Planctomycetota bacterium]
MSATEMTPRWDGRFDPSLAGRLPRSFALEHRVLPVRLEGGALVVAAAEPGRPSLGRWLRLHAGGPTRVLAADPGALARALREAYGESEAHYAALAGSELGAAAAAGGRGVVEALVAAAVRAGASDVHFEPRAEGLHVRWRVDGVLREADLLERSEREATLTRLLVTTGLDVANRRSIQDGRTQVVVDRRRVDVRVCAVPTPHGLSVVLRLLPADAVFADPAELGAKGSLREDFLAAVRPPEGMVLFAGPTGSGKSTSIDTAVELTRRPDQKVVSIEDPVERIKPGRTQIGVRHDLGFGFATALRHVLRHDPDVIVIGEVRDLETAEVAFQSALSGHKVFSTLHAGGALESVSRLLSLGLAPGLVAAALCAVVGQRLVRLLCRECRGEGCRACAQEGFSGRSGLFEVLRVSPELRRAIRARAPREELLALARATGFRPLREHGEARVAAGETTRLELLRATGFGPEEGEA